MVSSSLLDEALYAVASPIKVSNGCSGVRSKRMGIDRVFTKGISVGVRRTRISPQGLGYVACQAYGLFFTIR
jgi:hypothetical protein